MGWAEVTRWFASQRLVSSSLWVIFPGCGAGLLSQVLALSLPLGSSESHLHFAKNSTMEPNRVPLPVRTNQMSDSISHLV